MASAAADHVRAFRDRRQFPALDGLRAFSIIAVVWHHSETARHYTFPAAIRGFLGVDMFFVLSGFLIGTLLVRERAKNGTISLKGFWARRALRLIPAYLVVTGLLTARYLVGGGEEAGPFLRSLPAYLTYTSNWFGEHTVHSITWSLSTEEQFYLVVPLIMLLPRAPRLTLWLTLLALNLVVAFGVLDPYLPESILHREIMDVTFSPMFIGVISAELLAAEEATAAVRALAHPAAGLTALAGLAALLLLPQPEISGLWRTGIHVAMALLLVFVALRPDLAVVRALDVAPLRRIGVVSYGIYLWHMLVHNRVLTLERISGVHHPIVQFLATLLLTWLVAEVSYRVIERRFLLMKDKLSKR